jgi:hypothetical protein
MMARKAASNDQRKGCDVMLVYRAMSGARVIARSARSSCWEENG